MMSNQILQLINQLALFFPIFLIVFTFRGFFRTLIAKLMGDNTAYDEGHLTLNPLAHIDIMGLTIVIFILFFVGSLLSGLMDRRLLLLMMCALGIRWTFPIPVNEYNFKHHRLGGVLTSLAGPLSSFIIAFISLILFKFSFAVKVPSYALITMIEFFQGVADIGILFGVLDLLPIPPFDGGKAIGYLLPASKRHIFESLEQYSFIIIIVLLILPVTSDIVWGVISMVSSSIKFSMMRILFL